ncbi:MAG: hypothetical protein ACREBR_04320, partial [bacterium]
KNYSPSCKTISPSIVTMNFLSNHHYDMSSAITVMTWRKLYCLNERTRASCVQWWWHYLAF